MRARRSRRVLLNGRRTGDRHTGECERIAALLQRLFPAHRVIDEQELRRQERLRGAPLASATTSFGGRGERRLHRPDLVIWPQSEDGGLPVAVEVELTLKTPRTLSAICRAWARCHAVAGVLYIAAPLVEPTLRRTVAASGAGAQVWVMPLEAFAGNSMPSRAAGAWGSGGLLRGREPSQARRNVTVGRPTPRR